MLTPRPSLLLLAAAAVPGCVSSSAVGLAESRYPPRASDHPIAVFDRADDVQRPYLKVARVVGEGSDFGSFAAIVEAMRADARAVGADALAIRWRDAPEPP